MLSMKRKIFTYICETATDVWSIVIAEIRTTPLILKDGPDWLYVRPNVSTWKAPAYNTTADLLIERVVGGAKFE